MKTIKMETILNLPFHQATINYLAGIDPKLEWKARGISGHQIDKQYEKILKKQEKRAEDFLSTPAGKEKMNQFIRECGEIFLNLLYKEGHWIKNNFADNKFIFIIGAMRTGGTYLYTEINKILNIDWQNLNLKMTHDSIPTYDFLKEWKRVKNWMPLIFELAQFLMWAKKECSNQDVIIQKRIAYGHALELLSNIFGGQAEYIITVRHPGAIAASFKELEKIDMEERITPPGWKDLAKNRKGISDLEWGQLNYSERALLYWEIYYKDIAKNSGNKNNIKILGYNREDYEQFLNNFAAENNQKYTPTQFKISDRNYSNFWKSPEVDNVIDEVKECWSLHGLSFPELELK